jgi:hypothetical protein
LWRQRRVQRTNGTATAAVRTSEQSLGQRWWEGGRDTARIWACFLAILRSGRLRNGCGKAQIGGWWLWRQRWLWRRDGRVQTNERHINSSSRHINNSSRHIEQSSSNHRDSGDGGGGGILPGEGTGRWMHCAVFVVVCMGWHRHKLLGGGCGGGNRQPATARKDIDSNSNKFKADGDVVPGSETELREVIKGYCQRDTAVFECCVSSL